MIDSRLFEHIPETNTTRIFHYDEDTDIATIETQVDVTDLIERNKAIYNSVDERANWKGDGHWVGSIPMNLYWDLRKKGLVDANLNIVDQAEVNKIVAKFLNDRDNLAFRIRPGRI